ncbi:MAG: arginine decarboxylase [Pirellulaceae bacterium]|jgi:arginine decarboxylase
MLGESIDRWTIEDALEVYNIERWGKGYFSVNKQGHLTVHPSKDPDRSIDLKEIVDRLQQRGFDAPVLIRFNDVLQHRMKEIHDTFSNAIADHAYNGAYTCVFPVKVNQQGQVLEDVIRFGREYGFGLEAGSKPELLAVVAMGELETPIICNGFKDAEFIEMAMLAQKIGRQVIPVVEKFTELELVLRYARKVGVRPQIGVRVKLASRGSGRWQASGGFRSKFGLTVSEVLDVVEVLRENDMLDCFQLLHFHLGSQITNIRHVNTALVEATRIYVDLVHQGAGLNCLDIGGGLGVDYDGSQSNFESSVNYTLHEYANDVVKHVKTVCDDAGIAHPNIISESGRAIAAYHAVLVFGVLGVSGQGSDDVDISGVSEESPRPLRDLVKTFESITPRNVLQSYHDAQESLETATNLFSTGHLSLHDRAIVENLFWAVCRRIRRVAGELEYTPEELDGLDRLLSETYFCNFSLFQSMPDSWAIKQLFPVLPIHRLNEEPKNHAVLGDITCDSDGKIDSFIDCREIKRSLRLHAFDGSPYFLGAFLVGAYQEILGDLHNLFGDTNAAHVSMTEDGDVQVDSMIKGDTVSEVLNYVEIDDRDLINRLQRAVENAVRAGRLNHVEAGHFTKFYEQALSGYTYLEEAHEPLP